MAMTFLGSGEVEKAMLEVEASIARLLYNCVLGMKSIGDA